MHRKNDLRKLNRLQIQWACRGVTAIEMVVVLSVIIQLLILGAGYFREASEQLVQQAFARQIQTIHQATKHYVQDHYEAVAAAVGQQGGMTLELADLLDQGYLFPNVNLEQNTFHQQIKIGLNAVMVGNDPKKTVLQVITYTVAGSGLSELALRQMACDLGPEGGYISSLSKTEITGSLKGWSLPIDSLSGFWNASGDEEMDPSLEPGHIVMAAYVDARDALDASTFLRRVKVSGFAQGNVMETSLGVLAQEGIELGLPKGETIDPEKMDRTRLKHGELQFGLQEAKISIPADGILYLGDNCSLDNQGNLTLKGTVTISDAGEHYQPSKPAAALRVVDANQQSVDILPSCLAITAGGASKQSVLKAQYLKLDQATAEDLSADRVDSGSYGVSLSSTAGLNFDNARCFYAKDKINLWGQEGSGHFSLDLGYAVTFGLSNLLSTYDVQLQLEQGTVSLQTLTGSAPRVCMAVGKVQDIASETVPSSSNTACVYCERLSGTDRMGAGLCCEDLHAYTPWTSSDAVSRSIRSIIQ